MSEVSSNHSQFYNCIFPSQILCYFPRKSPTNFKILQACLIQVNTRDDKEDPRPPSTTTQDSPQTEYDGLLILLDHLDHQTEGEGKGHRDQDNRGEDQ